MKRAAICAVLGTAALLAGCGGGETLTGRFLTADNGGFLLIDGDGSPVVLSDQSAEGGLFEDLGDGDRIRVACGGTDESWPAWTGAYTCKLLERGGREDLPEDTLRKLAGMGWVHSHQPAAEARTVGDPVSGYCGNTVATVSAGEAVTSFWGGDSVTLTDILINLDYDPDQVCRCAPEYTADTEFGTGYGVSLRESYARCGDGQAALTAEQVKTIRDILDRNGCLSS